MTRFKKLHLLWMVPLLLVALILVLLNLFPASEFRHSDEFISQALGTKNLTATFHNYVDNGQTIHYWDISNPDKPLVMLVHGSPGSSGELLGMATDSVITSNFMVVAVDRPGFGNSDFGRAEKSLARQSELLGSVLKSYPNKKKILVGHSLGGPVIAKMAIDFPEEVSAIVILAGSVDPALEPNEWFRRPMASPLISWMIPTVFTASNDEIIDLKHELELMLPEWQKITVPVTVLQGTNDDLVPKENADFVKQMARNAPVKVRMLEGESHFFPFSRPEVVREELMWMIAGK